jgi:hypothetical protein
VLRLCVLGNDGDDPLAVVVETAADASIGMQATHSTVTAPARKAPHLWHLFLAPSSTSQTLSECCSNI